MGEESSLPPQDEAACSGSEEGLNDVEGFNVRLDWTAFFFLGEGDALEAKPKKTIKNLYLSGKKTFLVLFSLITP